MTATAADAQTGQEQPAARSEALVPRASQGVAVVGTGTTRDDAFALARAVYGSSLRPKRLDELRARILAGDPAPPSATKDVRELAELRAAVSGDDAASRKLLATIAQQLGVQALLVVGRAPAAPVTGEKEQETESETVPAEADAGAPPAAGAAAAGLADAGAAPVAQAGTSSVTARVFLADTGEFDAARYEPDASGWGATVTSLSSRFPPPPPPRAAQLQGPPPKLSSEGKGGRPLYASPWLWGAVGAAVLIGGFFFFVSRDTSDDPIHLQMRVPR